MHATPSKARRLLAAALLAGFGLSAPATAGRTDDAAAHANRLAYDATLKCAVANGLASDDHHDAGDAAKADEYRTKARRSFDLAYKIGAKLGLADGQIARDLEFAQDSELPRMMRDRSYYLSTAATCKAVGLM
ncbi:MAG: hypothetical protein WDM91_10020 [Rhizomicrobium sp.]